MLLWTTMPPKCLLMTSAACCIFPISECLFTRLNSLTFSTDCWTGCYSTWFVWILRFSPLVRGHLDGRTKTNANYTVYFLVFIRSAWYLTYIEKWLLQMSVQIFSLYSLLVFLQFQFLQGICWRPVPKIFNFNANWL